MPDEYQPLVSARKLHHDLNVGTNFVRWMWLIINANYDPSLELEKIVAIALAEGIDYVVIYKEHSGKGRPAIDDYMLSAKAAQKIRDYFVEPGRIIGRHRKSPNKS